jgi:hypothetical protein
MALVKRSIRVFLTRVEYVIVKVNTCSPIDLIDRIMRDIERNVQITKEHLQLNTGAVIHVRTSQSFPSKSVEFLYTISLKTQKVK